jgi:hypothetical protein
MTDTTFVLVFGAAILSTILALVWAYRASSGVKETPSDDEPIAITTGGEAEISIMVGKLEHAGLKALARNRLAEAANPIYGWELLVGYADVKDAHRILDLN